MDLISDDDTMAMNRISLRKIFKELTRRETLPTLITGSLLLLILHGIVKFEQIKENGFFQDLVIPVEEGFVPLGIDQPEQFMASQSYKVPKILHQTWKNAEIPSKFVGWIKTWTANHPDWTYMLWTDESARALIKDKYPFLLDTFDTYPEGIRKADALRYVILYEYGGIYADLDMESLLPVDPLAKKYHCFVSQEPYEHPVLDSGADFLVINALMGCRANHPFMKLLMDNLPAFKHMWNVLDSTGPHFVTLIYNQYIKKDLHEPSNEIYLAPPEYFFPTLDPAKNFWFRIQCGKFDKLSEKKKTACKTLKVRGVKRKPRSFSFTDHHWIHTYIDLRLTLKGPVNIYNIVPHAKIYKSSQSL